MTLSEMKALLRQYGLRPNPQLGQNFLVDATHLQRIVAAAELRSDDVVLEIGPGLGPLTEQLLAVVRQVISVELDRGFIGVLQDRFGHHPHFRLLHQDILQTDISALLAAAGTASYKCVANIPYYITSAVMRHLLESDGHPELIVLLVQREVAQRITAKPGDLSLLAISVQFFGEPEIVATVPAEAFFPAPKVDSAILRVRPYAEPRYRVAEPARFWATIKAGFGQKRKQLKNSLDAGLPRYSSEQINEALGAAAIDPTRRAQSLTIAEWVALDAALGETGATAGVG